MEHQEERHEHEVMRLISELMHQDADVNALIKLTTELSMLPKREYLWMNVLLLQLYQFLMKEAQGESSTSKMEHLLRALEKALMISNVKAIQKTEGQCFKLLQCLFSFMSKDEGNAMSVKMTDDCQLIVLGCIDILLTSDAPLPFLSTSIPFVAFMVSALITCAKTDLSRECRVLALQVLAKAIRSVDNAQVLTQVFPGLTSSLFQLIKADYKLGSKLPTQALHCLTEVTVLVLDDSRCDGLVETPDFTLAIKGDSAHLSSIPPKVEPKQSTTRENIPTIERSSSWLEIVRTNMAALAEYVCSHERHHPKPRVREALVDFCSAILAKCRLSLAPSFLSCYDTMLALSQDPIPSIYIKARSGLMALQQSMSPSELVLLHSQSSARFLMHTDALAKKCSVELDIEGEAIATFQVCIGYLVSPSSMEIVLETQAPRVLRSWCRILAIDSVDAHVLVHTTYGEDCVVAYYRKRFAHLRTDEAIQAAYSVLRLMGAVGNFLALVDEIIAQLQMESQTRPAELLIVLNQFILGAAQIDLPEQFTQKTSNLFDVHMAGYVLDCVLHLPQWNDSTSEECQSIIVEIIGSCAQVLGLPFNPLLMHVLYPIVEQLGRPSKLIQQSALATLQRIAYFCQYKTVPNLLHSNMDYVVDMLSDRLQQLEMYPHTPFVVQGLLKHAGNSPLPLLEEAVTSVVMSMDKHVSTTRHPLGLLRVMKVIVLNESRPSSVPSPQKKSQVDDFIQRMNELFHEDDYDSSADVTDPLHENEPSPEDEGKGAMPIEHQDGDDDSNPNKELKGMPKLIQAIVIRCSYFIAAPDVATSCLAWQVLEDAFGVFELNSLRPLVHRVWPMLVRRLSTQTNKPSLLAAIKCLGTLARLCGDFIGDKFIETVWPAFKQILRTYQPTSSLTLSDLQVQATASPIQLHSLTDQINFHLLVCIENMCHATDLMCSIAKDIAATCYVFLSNTVEASLQEQGRSLFMALAKLNGDELLPRLVYMADFTLPPPPSNVFPAFNPKASQKIADKVPTPWIYRQNATQLLHQLINTRTKSYHDEMY